MHICLPTLRHHRALFLALVAITLLCCDIRRPFVSAEDVQQEQQQHWQQLLRSSSAGDEEEVGGL
jgi:hypothetical protein